MTWLKKLRGGPSPDGPGPSPQLTGENAVVDARGCAVIPAGTVEIAANAFRNRPELRRVILPASVRTVRHFAFAQCPNLTQVRLNEGLQSLGSGVFWQCDRLRRLAAPDSLRQISETAFDGLSLRAPLLSRAKTVFYRCHGQGRAKRYAVPASVRRLACGAFPEGTALEALILPRQLRAIEAKAFCRAEIRRITLPAALREVQAGAFWECRALERLDIRCDRQAIQPGALHRCAAKAVLYRGAAADFPTQLHLRGEDPLREIGGLREPPEAFWQTPPFSALAERCAAGDARAMWALADALQAGGEAPFYAGAANFWRYRAFQYGNPQAKAWNDRWWRDHPREQIPAAMGSQLKGAYRGSFLRAMGFPFFDPARRYQLGGVDQDGLVEVSAWSEADEPDEDGFGREDYYDWWLLDAHLRELPGVAVIRSASCRERQRERWRAFDCQRDAALKALRARRAAP